jgi:hypothetical protein
MVQAADCRCRFSPALGLSATPNVHPPQPRWAVVVNPMSKTISLGLVAILAFAGGALAAVTTVNLSNAAAPSLPMVGDADGDRIPDALEKELCSRPLTRDQLARAEAGRCVDANNYLPPEERHIVPLYITVVPGPDADGDLLPAYIRLTSTIVTIDPFQTKEPIVRMTPSAEFIDVPIDTQDADKSQPVLTRVTSPIEIPIGVELGRDGDRDLLPGVLTLKWAKLTVDRSNVKAVISYSPITSQDYTIDENDKDANVPATSFVEIALPAKVSHTGDFDNDLLPGAVTVSMDTYKLDRRLGTLALSYVGRTDTTKTIDEDETKRDNVLPLSAIDADVDFLPDSVELLVCMVQSETMAEDGKCVRSDGTGPDGSGTNFVAPVGVRNPWSFQPGN